MFSGEKVDFLNARVCAPPQASFIDREVWSGAADVNGLNTVDFDAVSTDLLLDPDLGGAAFDAGSFVVEEIGSQANATSIDAAPFILGDGVNGTPHLLAELQAGASRVTRITFALPIVAFGAETLAQFSDYVVTYTLDDGLVVEAPMPTSPSFFGFVTAQPFTSVTLTSNFAGAAAFDNVSFVDAPLPP